ncbi:MAG: hypothetical protein AUH13_06490 [Acidobacteria bacterium 13_2_20CM_58_27]|nr:MAG: hypothetical protein AUH13_06490 [Acidobacteria bacterium 13_2_20CM_58_27]
MGRQGHQRGTFLLEGLRRNQPGFRHRAMFHADRGPLEGLLIQIFQAGKVAPREEVRFYGPEAAFLAGFAVGMPLFMADESEAVRGGEGGHLRHDHRIPPGAPQTGQVRVIDHTDPPGIAPEHQGCVQEAFHAEAVELSEKLQVPPLRVTQIEQAGNHQS